MNPALLDTISNQLFKVLDITKTGFFKRADLVIFINIMVIELEIQNIGTLKEDQIDEMLKSTGIHDLNKINQI